ncbi:HAD family hydrolase [Actinomadura madurae]|uniref:HAD family hydrolase n=1 Tax=Actinomadura madurae TaxID=1993 RepID=UPI0020D24DBF|nr:HAD family hydrolase [Actinomadura madurae]MCP9983905.1 HAD family hydrolase [Actinomadura madurae]
MTVLVCADLDRTLIYSAAAFALDGPDETMPRLLCVEFYQGAPLSYMTEAAARTLEALSTAATLVPTTTRTPEQYRRVQLLDKPPRFAICANGGHLLVDGREDPEWAAAVRSQVADACAPLADVQHHLTQSGGDFVLKRRTASDLFAYTVVDRASLPPGWVEDLTGWCAERGWRTSLQGRKVYCLPACLTKAAAAAEVARRAAAPGMLAARRLAARHRPARSRRPLDPSRPRRAARHRLDVPGHRRHRRPRHPRGRGDRPLAAGTGGHAVNNHGPPRRPVENRRTPRGRPGRVMRRQSR